MAATDAVVLAFPVLRIESKAKAKAKALDTHEARVHVEPPSHAAVWTAELLGGSALTCTGWVSTAFSRSQAVGGGTA